MKQSSKITINHFFKIIKRFLAPVIIGAIVFSFAFAPTIFNNTGVVKPALAAGNKWEYAASPTCENLNTVWGSKPNDVYAAGDNNTIIHYDGTSWSSVDTSGFLIHTNFLGSFGKGTYSVQLVGSQGGAEATYGSWTDDARGWFGKTLNANAVWGDKISGDYIAVGAIKDFGGNKAYAEGSSSGGWDLKKIDSMDAVTFDEPMLGVWGTSRNNIYAVGGTIIGPGSGYGPSQYDGISWINHFDGTHWTRQVYDKASTTTGQGPLRSIWGTGPNDIWAVGGSSVTSGMGRVIYHYNGNSWSLAVRKAYNAPASLGKSALGVWASSTTPDVWAVGDDILGFFSYYNGSVWKSVNNWSHGESYHAVWGSGPNDVWAVGAAGHIMHYHPATGEIVKETPCSPDPAPTIQLSANPSTIDQGDSSTLRWITTNTISVSINQGIGTVAPPKSAADGTVSVSPTVTTTYIATATGPGGTAPATAKVTVIPIPPPPSASRKVKVRVEWQEHGVTKSVEYNTILRDLSTNP